uniref:MARVEL domain-containing protein n=1 Tax=Panagrellus redivivus TaxID=6233 RepID=A0A7E4VRU4_PANRE
MYSRPGCHPTSFTLNHASIGLLHGNQQLYLSHNASHHITTQHPGNSQPPNRADIVQHGCRWRAPAGPLSLGTSAIIASSRRLPPPLPSSPPPLSAHSDETNRESSLATAVVLDRREERSFYRISSPSPGLFRPPPPPVDDHPDSGVPGRAYRPPQREPQQYTPRSVVVNDSPIDDHPGVVLYSPASNRSAGGGSSGVYAKRYHNNSSARPEAFIEDVDDVNNNSPAHAGHPERHPRAAYFGSDPNDYNTQQRQPRRNVTSGGQYRTPTPVERSLDPYRSENNDSMASGRFLAGVSLGIRLFILILAIVSLILVMTAPGVCFWREINGQQTSREICPPSNTLFPMNIDRWNSALHFQLRGQNIWGQLAIIILSIVFAIMPLFFSCIYFGAGRSLTFTQLIATGICIIAFLVFGGFETWYATGFDHMPLFIRQIGGGTFSGCAGIPACETGFVVKGWAAAAAFYFLAAVLFIIDAVVIFMRKDNTAWREHRSESF